MLTNKQRKLFYILYEISKRNIIENKSERESNVNRFVKDFGSAAYNFKKLFDEKKLFGNYEEGSKNFKKNLNNFIKNIYYKLFIIIDGVSNNFNMLKYNINKYDKSLFYSNYRIYEGISFLINAFGNFEFEYKLKKKRLIYLYEITYLQKIIYEYSFINRDYMRCYFVSIDDECL